MQAQRLLIMTVAGSLAAAAPAAAQTIYPINRAEILEGSHFDFKVEFPDAPASADVKVTINGKSADEVFGKPTTFLQNEEGQKHSALWLRGASLPAGSYTVEATQGADRKATVKWEVFATAQPRRAKNVILFIGDGMSVANRTAARILSKGLVEGRYNGELAMDDMSDMALISTSGTDSVVTDSANAAHAYTTGHKSCVNALGVYCAKNALTLDHPKVETIAELVKRKTGMAVGVVTNSEIEDARLDGRSYPPPLRLQRHRQDVLRCEAGRDHGWRLAEFPRQDHAGLQAHRRRGLHREVQGGGLHAGYHQG